MSRTPTVSFANLICRFGERFVLLDFAKEIVLPAFEDTMLQRRYAATRYFFFNIQVGEIRGSEANNVPLVVVHGRLVKDTMLTREQVFSPEHGLLTAQESMPSAPSSFFVLILNNHKLVYLPETAHAPSLGSFEATLQRFLGIKYQEYINALFEQLKSTAEPKPKRQLYQEVPHPVVQVLPLASKASIEQFLEAFAKVTHLEFRILDTNQEYQMQETYRRIREMKQSVRARTTKLIHDSPAGLDKAQAIEQIHASVATGNQAVQLAGRSPDGVRLKGDNQSFKLSVQLEGVPENPTDRAVRLVRLYEDQVQHGILMEDVGADTDDKIRRIRESRDDA